MARTQDARVELPAPMETLHKEAVMETAPHEDKLKDGSTEEELDPWNPPYPPCPPCPPVADLNVQVRFAMEWLAQKRAILATSRASKIITPDRTPESVNIALFKAMPCLTPILEKDSHRRFLSLFAYSGQGMGWGYVITPETFDNIIMQNALQCAKVALKGRAPELNGYRANPNYMTQYGYFPLHRAAEMFSVEMIELLLRHGASANLSTVGPVVTEGLLPLHVAVENTCLHKYLEDGLFHHQMHQDCSVADMKYVYKLVHLLCLPELKIFLDTVRLLAKHTDNLLDQLWIYIKDGKLTQTAVLLLAAQEQIRTGTSHKSSKVNSKLDGFAIITGDIVHKNTLQSEACENIMDSNQPSKINANNATLLSLIDLISRAGAALDLYIRAHPKVPYVMHVSHSEVLERVSLILKEHGFCRTGARIDIGDLCPYENVLSIEDRRAKSAAEVGYHAAKEEGKIKKISRGWELKYARRSFFPYWRSVLEPQSCGKMTFVKPMLTVEQINHDKRLGKSTHIGSAFGGLTGRVQPVANHQPRRLFCTASLTLLKVLRNA
ncbi:hypothetical protein QYE76_056455 [Lolium multiflorum]|uniref:Uncharacterized protein n=1 Tax=Lolium multiflorum TaxID=4521 RepID=A0AAD8T1P0_LOLMU|nr:hypothetical protein QYE76_056455 [Lolium multiflorum]